MSSQPFRGWRLVLPLCLLLVSVAPARAQQPPVANPMRWGMVIHGGAGTIPRGSLTPEREAEYHAKLAEALRAGHAVLARGGGSVDAVNAAVNLLEDSPLFNAGKGAVFTADGKNELDAAIMDGRNRAAGAVAGVHRVRNPINLARAVMEKSPHVLLVGDGAEQFAREHGIALVDPSYFRTDARWEALQRAKERERGAAAGEPMRKDAALVVDDRKFGTVGAVALDQAGNLAAGTSTGGMTNKRWGRVGDVPLIGAGTYANNETCAVSATGHGEFFIRAVVAYDICARMKYTGVPLREAAESVVLRDLVEFGGEGGVIAMDRRGNWAMPFNSSGMYRGRIDAEGNVQTEIYGDQ